MLIETVKTLLGRTDVTQIRQRSALNPFLFLSGIGVAGGAVFTLIPGMQVLGAIIAAVPLFTTLGVGVFFAATDRDRLQGEEYLTQRHSISTLKAMSGIVDDPADLIPMLNPALRGETQDAIRGSSPPATMIDPEPGAKND